MSGCKAQHHIASHQKDWYLFSSWTRRNSNQSFEGILYRYNPDSHQNIDSVIFGGMPGLPGDPQDVLITTWERAYCLVDMVNAIPAAVLTEIDTRGRMKVLQNIQLRGNADELFPLGKNHIIAVTSDIDFEDPDDPFDSRNISLLSKINKKGEIEGEAQFEYLVDIQSSEGFIYLLTGKDPLGIMLYRLDSNLNIIQKDSLNHELPNFKDVNFLHAQGNVSFFFGMAEYEQPEIEMQYMYRNSSAGIYIPVDVHRKKYEPFFICYDRITKKIAQKSLIGIQSEQRCRFSFIMGKENSRIGVHLAASDEIYVFDFKSFEVETITLEVSKENVSFLSFFDITRNENGCFLLTGGQNRQDGIDLFAKEYCP